MTPESLWSTPSYGERPTQYYHSRTTTKRVFARRNPSNRHEDEFRRDVAHLPPGAIGFKRGWAAGGGQYLFKSREACLRFMAERFDDQADQAERKAVELRAAAVALRKELIA